jgi:tellurite resistance protein
MHEQDKSVLRSLVAVAWADGRMMEEETEVLEALLQAFEATPEDQVEIRAFAKTRRTLDDIPLAELAADDRRILLQHAVLITYIDGEQAPGEKQLLSDLCDKLRIPKDEGEALVEAASAQAKRFLDLV